MKTLTTRYNLTVLIARRFVISGRVQGVGFRYFAREFALVEGLSGSAANLPDGRVDIRVEGERQSVDRFERKIRRGPPPARVEHVDVFEEVPSARAGTFDVR